MSGARPQSRPPQRWPDIMIAVLTLALLGGFGTLLLQQKPKAPTATQSVNTTTAPTAAIPASPGTVPPPANVTTSATPEQTATSQSATSEQPTGTQTSSTPPVAAQTQQTPEAQTTAATTPASQTPAPSPETTNSSATTATSEPAATAPASASTASTSATTRPAVESTSQIPPVPKAPPVQAITPPVLPETTPAQTTTTPSATTTTVPTSETQTSGEQTPATQTPESTAQTPAASTTPATSNVAPRSGGAIATIADRTPLRSEYRISLGSFATSRTVQTQTSAVSGLGYKVHAIDLGNQYVAQIGPFADEATARQALADIQRAYPGALLYRPRVKATAASDSTSDNTSDNSSATATRSDTSSTTSTSSATAPDGPRYLQVGAFDRPESAQKLVGILRDHDFAPTVSSPPDSKTTVMVGPYSGGALLRAEARLDNAGLEHFRVR